MPHALIDHNSDLKRLYDDGLEIEIRNGFLLVHHVPYVNREKVIKYGTLVSSLELAGDKTIKPGTHVIHFVGESPCHKDGSIIGQIQHASGANRLAEGVVVDHSFSNKPANGYPDYYSKVTTYVGIIAGPAKSLDDGVTEKTFAVIEPEPDESVFNYIETNSSRAGIGAITSKLRGQRIAIIGLGGTGSYILDFLAKCPVAEIHLFDDDDFLSHNAFRAPGAPTAEELRGRVKKTAYFAQIYSKMHRHVIDRGSYIHPTNFAELLEMDFVFLSFEGELKRQLVEYLVENMIRFIDAGMGIHTVKGEDQLVGVLRVTSTSESKRDHVRQRIPFTTGENNEYSQNIQIAELNALNATMAVIKWKKMCGFYQDLENEHHTTYSINVSQLLNEDLLT
jgi:hypothetical protein